MDQLSTLANIAEILGASVDAIEKRWQRVLTRLDQHRDQFDAMVGG